MLYWTRKVGSRRASVPHEIRMGPNFAGQGGYDFMYFRLHGVWHCIQPESMADVRELQSQAAILAHNVKDDNEEA